MTKHELLSHADALNGVRNLLKRSAAKGAARFGDVSGALAILTTTKDAISAWTAELKVEADRLTADIEAGRIRAKG